MPKIRLEEVEAKKTRHPRFDQELKNVAAGKKERVSMTLPAAMARRIKAAAKADGMTIKQYVLDALLAKHPDLGDELAAYLEAGHE